LPPPATFGGFSAFSAPTQIVTGSAVLISGRVADPAGDRVDAIHVYRDLDGNGVLDPGSDGLLHADTTPADGYAFHAGLLPSGRHVLYVAAIKDGAVVGSRFRPPSTGFARSRLSTAIRNHSAALRRCDVPRASDSASGRRRQRAACRQNVALARTPYTKALSVEIAPRPGRIHCTSGVMFSQGVAWML
jgi:hypothetical protein